MRSNTQAHVYTTARNSRKN